MKKLLTVLITLFSAPLIHTMGLEQKIVLADKAIQSYRKSDFSIAFRMNSAIVDTIQPELSVKIPKIIARLDYRSQLPLIEYLIVKNNKLKSVYFNEKSKTYNGGIYSLTQQAKDVMEIKLIEEDSDRVDYEEQFKQTEAEYQSK